MTAQAPVTQSATASGAVLVTLASAQFLMTLDSAVMNVFIATAAKDGGTTVTGIQTAITKYTPNVQAWLAKHPRITLHFTPT